MVKPQDKPALGKTQERFRTISADQQTSPSNSSSSKNTVAGKGTVAMPSGAGTSALGIRQEAGGVSVSKSTHAETAEAPVPDCVHAGQEPVRASSRTTESINGTASVRVDAAGSIALNVRTKTSAEACTAKTRAESTAAAIAEGVIRKQETRGVSLRTIVSDHGATGNPPDGDCTAFEILQEPCTTAVPDKPETEPVKVVAAGTVPGEKQPPPSKEVVRLVEPPVAPTMVIRPEVSVLKRSYQRGHRDKHRSQRRRGTVRDSIAKSPQDITCAKSVAGSRAHEGPLDTIAGTSGATSCATSGATRPATIQAANDATVGAQSQKSLQNPSAAASGASSPATLPATLAASGALPTAADSVPKGVVKDGCASKQKDVPAAEAAVPSSVPRAGGEQEVPAEADPPAATGERPAVQVDYMYRPSPVGRGARTSTAEATKHRRQTTEDLLASIANLECDFERGRTLETQSIKSAALFKGGKCTLTKAQIRITVAFTGACIFLLFFIIFLRGVVRQPTTDYALCITADCVRHATLLTKHLNRTLDPCEDYAAFVCSAWEPAKAHFELARSAMDDLRFTWYDHFVDTLTRGSLKILAGRKPLAMYNMCWKNYPHNASQMSLVLGFLDRLGLAWPGPPKILQPPLGMFVAFSYKWQMSFWITVTVRRHTASGRRQVFVSPGLYIPILFNHHRSVAWSYTRYWQQFLLLFYPDIVDRPPMNETAVNEIRIMEEDVINKIFEVVQSSRKKPASFSFKDVVTHVRKAAAADWVEDFQAGLSLEPNLSDDDEIVATDVAFLETVTKLLVTYSKLQLNMHVAWLIVQYLTIPGDYSVLVRYYGSAEKAAKLLPIYCSHHVEVVFKVLISALGFVSRFTVRDRETIDTGFTSLVSAAVERVNNSPWMDDKSKARMREKLSSVTEALWPPASLLSNNTLEEIYAHFPWIEPSYAHYWFLGRIAASKVNVTQSYEEAIMLMGNNFPAYAGYNYVHNVVELALGAAAPPAFYPSGTKGMLYGGLLFIMAMQLVRAIDAEGIKWSSSSNVVEGTILSKSALREFTAREQCEHGTGKTGVFPELPALEITYAALTASQFRDPQEWMGISQELPERKVFFMTMCYMTCASPGAHSAIAVDCNKVVRNSEAFAEAYGCRKGSKMNPEKKCIFFS